MPAKDTPKVPYDDAAAQAVAEVQTSPVPSEVPVSTVAGDPLPNETLMDQMMTQFKAMSEKVAQMEAQLTDAQRGYAAATAALGPPPVATYGKAIYDKLVSHRNAHPDLAGHFDAVIEKARPLAEASAKVLDGTGQADEAAALVPDTVDYVDHFITKTHSRTTSKAVDFSALAADLEYASAAAA